MVYMRSIVEEKSRKFALRIINLNKYLVQEKNEYVMSKQVLRCGTSIGANIAEAECAFSDKDFLSKMYIAYKETAETKYWLKLLVDSEYISSEQFVSMQSDCEEINRMLSSITKTMREKIGD